MFVQGFAVVGADFYLWLFFFRSLHLLAKARGQNTCGQGKQPDAQEQR